MLHRLVSSDGHPLDNTVLTEDRQYLVDRFNAIVGPPGPVIEAMQKDFIVGNMPFDEMVSYIRFCEYMIHANKIGEAVGLSRVTSK